MADNNDYQLEEMENSAVNKIAMAKRAAMGAGLLAGGAAAAYGAEHVINGGDDVATHDDEPADLSAGAAAGAVDGGVEEQQQAQAQAEQPDPQTAQSQSAEPVETRSGHARESHHHEETGQGAQFDTSTHYYDDDGNLVGAIDKGTLDGRDFAVIDQDGDGKADLLWYDENSDGSIDQSELQDVSGADYAMGQHGGEHVDINVNTGEEISGVHDQGGQPGVQPTSGTGIEITETNHYYDDDGNQVATVNYGSVGGQTAVEIDRDNDGVIDQVWFDSNNDGQIQDDEKHDVSGRGLAMSQSTGKHADINLNTGEEIAGVHGIGNYQDHDISDIKNDFTEKSGEEYRGDLAENNQDYRNHEDASSYSQYAAGHGADGDDLEIVEEKYEVLHEDPSGDYTLHADGGTDTAEEHAEPSGLDSEGFNDEPGDGHYAYDGDADGDNASHDDMAFDDHADDNEDAEDLSQYDLV